VSVPGAARASAPLGSPLANTPSSNDLGLSPPFPGPFPGRPLSSGPGEPGPLNAPFININMTDAGGEQNEISLAVDMAGRVLGAWNDWRTGQPDYRCGMSTSVDRGLTFGANQIYSYPGYSVAGDPVAVTDTGGRMYLVCMPFNRGPNRGTMVVRTSLDGGQTWVNTAEIGVDGTNNLDDKPWAATYGDGTLAVVWGDFPGSGGSHLVGRTTRDGGFTWGAAVNVTSLASGGNWAAVDFDRYGRLHLAYSQGGSHRYKYSDDFGATWSAPVTISAHGAGCGGCTPRSNQISQLASDPTGNNLYVVWSGDLGDPGGENIYLAHSNNRGASWSRVQVNDDVTANRQFMPSVDVDHDGVVHLIWSDLRSGQHAVYYANSTDGGVTISTNVRVSDVEAATVGFMGDYQQITADDWGRAHIAYIDTRTGNGDAYYARAELATPGPHWVNITPVDATVPLGFTLQYTATVHDPFGNTPTDLVEWRVSGGGTISPTGLFTPSALGTYQVTAYAGFRFDTTNVTVVPGPLDRIFVVPAVVALSAGSMQQFTAFGYDAWGNPVPTTPTWTSQAGSITAGGLFTGMQAGVWKVFANDSGVSGNATATVTAGALASITVTPPTATITADDLQQYTATGADLYGNPVAVSPAWGVSAGSITGLGLYFPSPVGTFTVFANQSGVVGTASVTVVAGALASITVSPASATISADQTQAFTATGADAKGNPVPVSPTWSANGGSIDGTGLYTGGPVGTWTVTATDGLLTDTASITVIPGALASILVSPPFATITADETQGFTATGYDADGNLVSLIPTWATTKGSISLLGLYRPSLVGTWTVYANRSGISGNASITVTTGALATLVVSPSSAVITADQTQAYTAEGFDAHGNRVPVSPTWSVTGGSISALGVFTPNVVGTFTVTAAQGAITGTATVTVLAGALVRITVAPPTATITADQTQLFAATGFDAFDNPVSVSPTWATTGGSISGLGVYTPDLVGTYTVYANQSGASGSASVTVTPGLPASLVVTPPTATITAGETQQFTAEAFDANGNPTTALYTWTATAGSVSSSGLYAPGPLGTFSVTATSGSLFDWGSVTVIAGTLARIAVSPASATISADVSISFLARGYDAAGNPVPISPVWTTTMGTIDSSGLYTPSLVGTYEVRATDGSLFGTASVTVVAGALASILVTPGTATITADETVQFTATGYDAKGNVVSVTLSWSASGGQVTAGLYTGGPVGAHAVTARSGSITGTASVSVTAGAPALVAVSPGSASLTIGGSQRFTATVTDADGNPVSASVVWSSTGVGSVSGSGEYSATAVGAASVTATVGPASGSASVTVAAVVVPPDEKPQAPGVAWWMWLIPLLVAVSFLILFLVWRRRRKEYPKATTSSGPEAPRDLPPPPPDWAPPPPP